MDLIIDFYKNLDYLGPNCEDQTVNALNYIQLPNDNSIKVVDIGCGTGRQSEILATELGGKITAIDLFEEFVESAKMRSFQKNLNISVFCGDMGDLPFEEEEFDLIYSEGAIYNIGFENGINYWKKFIKPNGYLIVSEVSWTSEKRPEEIQSYWNNEYKEIDTCKNKIKQLEKAGYELIKNFILPQRCWENYYNNVEEEFDSFLKRQNDSKEALDFVEELKEEIRVYNKYKEYFSYVFYIAKKLAE